MISLAHIEIEYGVAVLLDALGTNADLRKTHFELSESLGERYFIQKPFVTVELLRRINAIIESNSNKNSCLGINDHKN